MATTKKSTFILILNTPLPEIFWICRRLVYPLVAEWDTIQWTVTRIRRVLRMRVTCGDRKSESGWDGLWVDTRDIVAGRGAEFTKQHDKWQRRFLSQWKHARWRQSLTGCLGIAENFTYSLTGFSMYRLYVYSVYMCTLCICVQNVSLPTTSYISTHLYFCHYYTNCWISQFHKPPLSLSVTNIFNFDIKYLSFCLYIYVQSYDWKKTF